MRHAPRSVNPRSLGLWPAILTLAASAGLCGATTGCIFIDEDDDDVVIVDETPDPNPPVETMKVAIDADKTMTTEPGEGVGLFIEYATGGHWHVYTACDTNLSSFACAFDVIVSVIDPATEISNVKTENLTGEEDFIQVDGTAEVHLYTKTTTALNGVTFDATPGAVLEVDTYLDNKPGEHFVYWIGEGVLHTGAPSNPLQLSPTEGQAAPPSP
jgi:hypothetical protein